MKPINPWINRCNSFQNIAINQWLVCKLLSNQLRTLKETEIEPQAVAVTCLHFPFDGKPTSC